MARRPPPTGSTGPAAAGGGGGGGGGGAPGLFQTDRDSVNRPRGLLTNAHREGLAGGHRSLVRREAPEVVDPGDTRPPGAGDHHLAGDRGPARGRAALEGDGDEGGLLGTQAVGGLDGEGRVLHRVLEGGGLEEDVFEGDGGGAAGLDDEGALGLGREGKAEEGDAVLPSERGGELQRGPGFAQLAGLVSHLHAHLRAPRASRGRADGFLGLEVGAVGLQREEKRPWRKGSHKGRTSTLGRNRSSPAITWAGVPFPCLCSICPTHTIPLVSARDGWP